jgi:hypothetical protein
MKGGKPWFKGEGFPGGSGTAAKLVAASWFKNLHRLSLVIDRVLWAINMLPMIVTNPNLLDFLLDIRKIS